MCHDNKEELSSVSTTTCWPSNPQKEIGSLIVLLFLSLPLKVLCAFKFFW